MRRVRTRFVSRVVLLLALARVAAAQDVRGTVRDSGTSLPIPGAVVTLLDAGDAVLGRNLTNQRGEYRLPWTPGGRRVRVVRLGFRPRVLPVPAPVGGSAQLDVMMTAIPVTLESVRTVSGVDCPLRPDGEAALALLEQARSGLLTTVVSRGMQPARMKRLLFNRLMDGTSDSIVHQRVRIDSAVTMASFEAVRSASAFVKQGFMRDSAGVPTFFAPDAETLLDDGFAGGYCFRVADAEQARPHQIGLGFRAADSRRGRVDIDGALWIDTVARALVGIEFHYVGLDRAYEPYHPGGRVSFRAMPNGVVMVDRWMLRLVDPRDLTAVILGRPQPREATTKCPTTMCFKPAEVPRFDVQEMGGELASAVWDDGSAWKGSLGRLVVHARRDTAQAGARTVMKLDDTEYQATGDASGDLTFEELLPGPYGLVVVDPDLAPLGVTLTSDLSFVAVRDSTFTVRMMVPTAAGYAAQVCEASGSRPASSWLFGRVTTPDGRPVGGATWLVERSVDGTHWAPVEEGGPTGLDGTFHHCGLALGMTVRVTAKHRGAADVSRVLVLNERLAIVRLEMKPR